MGPAGGSYRATPKRQDSAVGGSGTFLWSLDPVPYQIGPVPRVGLVATPAPSWSPKRIQGGSGNCHECSSPPLLPAPYNLLSPIFTVGSRMGGTTYKG